MKKENTQQLIDELKLIQLQECHAQIDLLQKQIRKYEIERVDNHRDFLCQTIKTLSDFWRHNAGDLSFPTYLGNGYEDPVRKYVNIPKELFPIMYSPLVQRLNYINQLSFGYYAFPMGNHSRLAHSLGTLKFVQQIFRHIFSEGVIYTPKGVKQISLSSFDKKRIMLLGQCVALLHDIGHGPFGHALDRYICYNYLRNKGITTKHLDKYYSPKYILECLSDTINNIKIDGENAFTAEQVASILDKGKQEELTGFENFIVNLIDSALDIDRLDYVSRDSYASGISQAFVNTDAIVQNAVPFEDDDEVVYLAFREDALPHIEHMFSARDIMFLCCYEHGAKVCGDKLIEKALDSFIKEYKLEDYIEDILLLTDQQLINLMLSFTTPTSVCNTYIHTLEAGLKFDEVWRISPKDIEQKRRASPLIDEFSAKQTRNPKEAYFDMPAAWEEEVARRAGVEKWQIIIIPASHEVAIPHEEQANILIDIGVNAYKLELAREVSHILQSGYVDILRSARNVIRIFGWSGLSSDKRDDIACIVDEYFFS